MREIIFGVGVSFNGAPVNFEDDMRPFVMGGRTFLPVRAVANLFGAEVDFDSATNTVILRSDGATAPIAIQPAPTPTPTPTPEPTPAPKVEKGPLTEVATLLRRSDDRIVFHALSAVIDGVTYNSVLNFRRGGVSKQYSVYELNGHSTLSGHIGWTNGTSNNSHRNNAVLNLAGDGRLLGSFDVSHSSPAIPYSVDVRGVRELTVEVVFVGHSDSSTWSETYAMTGILE
jgi:hypothetical protein